MQLLITLAVELGAYTREECDTCLSDWVVINMAKYIAQQQLNNYTCLCQL